MLNTTITKNEYCPLCFSLFFCSHPPSLRRPTVPPLPCGPGAVPWGMLTSHGLVRKQLAYQPAVRFAAPFGRTGLATLAFPASVPGPFRFARNPFFAGLGGVPARSIIAQRFDNPERKPSIYDRDRSWFSKLSKKRKRVYRR